MKQKTNRVSKGFAIAGYALIWGLIVALLIILLFFVAQSRGIFTARMSSGTEAVYNLSGQDLTGFMGLEDGWKYFPGQRIITRPSENVRQQGFINLNTGMTDQGKSADPEEASYEIELVGIRERLAFFLPFDGGSYDLFINGRKIQTQFDRLLITQTITTLEPEIDYEIVIESDSQIPAPGSAPMIISLQAMEHMLDLARVIMFITLGISIFSLAVVIAVCFSASREESGHLVKILLLTLFNSLWYVFYTNKYFPTVNFVFPRIADETIILMIAALITCSLSVLILLLRPYLLEYGQNRAIKIIPYILIAVLLILLGISQVPSIQGSQWMVILIAMFLLFLTLLLLLRKLIRRETRDYLQLCAQATILVAFGIAMMFSSNLLDLNYMMIVSALIIIFHLLMVVSIFKHNYEMRKRLEEANEAQQKMLHLQGAFWASQIQPHFIYNTLQAIQALCMTDPEKAVELTGKFSKHLRNSVDYINSTELIPFTSELANVNNYVEIQQVRFGEKLIYIQNIEYRNFRIPPLTVQPLVENAIRYGVRGRKGPGTVCLEVKRRSDGIAITVTDSGPGFDPEMIKENGGIENVRSRLTAYLQSTLEYLPVEEGAAVQIFIPAGNIVE